MDTAIAIKRLISRPTAAATIIATASTTSAAAPSATASAAATTLLGTLRRAGTRFHVHGNDRADRFFPTRNIAMADPRRVVIVADIILHVVVQIRRSRAARRKRSGRPKR